jgi:hypothetical protein
MPRTLKPGPSAYAAVSFILVMALALPFGFVVAYGEWFTAIKALAVLAVGCGLVARGISRTRIVLSDDAISFKYSIGLEQRVRLSDIYESRLEKLHKRGNPICLHIYGDTGNVTDEGEVVTVPLLQIRLKSFRQPDVDWLLSQPGLKVVRPGP